MTPEEKIAYVKKNIDDETAINPSGQILYYPHSVGHPDNPEEWYILNRDEHKRIIRKLEEDGYIKNVKFYSKNGNFLLEKVEKDDFEKYCEYLLDNRNSNEKDDRSPIGVANFYVTKKDDDFYYKGNHLELSKSADYYKVFCALYAKIPKGGTVYYKDLIEEVRNRIPKTKKMSDTNIKKFIQNKLTTNQEGFLRKSHIPITQDNSKKLITTERGIGIVFNNKMG